MSHTRVKTTYGVEGEWGSTETKELYCHHNHSCDITSFRDKDGEYVSMIFQSWDKGNDLLDAMERLLFPFKDKWGGELKDGVEYYGVAPWEGKKKSKRDELAEKIKSQFGESLIEEGAGEEDPYNWWLQDVTVTDIVDFIEKQ